MSNIPEVAIETAAKALRGYTGDCTCHEGYSGRNLIDPECLYHDVPPEAVKDILEAAAPYMLAAAWAEGARAGFDATREGFNGECAFDHCAPDHYPPTNPYSGDKWEVESFEA